MVAKVPIRFHSHPGDQGPASYYGTAGAHLRDEAGQTPTSKALTAFDEETKRNYLCAQTMAGSCKVGGALALKIKKQKALESDAFGGHQQKRRRGRPRKQK